jgi:hypothetical protein
MLEHAADFDQLLGRDIEHAGSIGQANGSRCGKQNGHQVAGQLRDGSFAWV